MHRDVKHAASKGLFERAAVVRSLVKSENFVNVKWGDDDVFSKNIIFYETEKLGLFLSPFFQPFFPLQNRLFSIDPIELFCIKWI